MKFTEEEQKYLIDNEYAKSLAISIGEEVYPFLYFTMQKMGIKFLEFHFPTKNIASVSGYKCRIKIVEPHENHNPNYEILNILFSIPDGESEYCLQRSYDIYINMHSSIFLPIPTEEDPYKYESLDIGLIDCMLYYIKDVQVEEGTFKNINEFYIFFCENLIKLSEELKFSYCDGFKKLNNRIASLAMPLIRQVLVEKIKKIKDGSN